MIPKMLSTFALGTMLLFNACNGPTQECERDVYTSDDGLLYAQILNPDGITLPRELSLPFGYDHRAYGDTCSVYVDGKFQRVGIENNDVLRYTMSSSKHATSRNECPTNTLVNMHVEYLNTKREAFQYRLRACAVLRQALLSQ